MRRPPRRFRFICLSYSTDRNRRYPVVYLLHGYTNTDLGYFGSEGRQLRHRRARGRQRCGPRNDSGDAERHECIWRKHVFEFDDGRRLGGGAAVADDLVAYMDKTYRTIAWREGRGLAGHSMGGYGTMRIGMKRPDVFSAIYALSSCCLNEGTVRARGTGPSPAELVKTMEEARGNRGAQGTLARAAAWAPIRRTRRSIWTANEERRSRSRSGREVGGQFTGRDARSIRAEPQEDESYRSRHRLAGQSDHR